MKHLFTSIFVVFLFLGCSRDTAFDRFPLSAQQKLAENSIQSSKIIYKGDVDGIVSVIYLNEIFPKRFYKNEYFYVYLYTKDKEPKLTFLLNKKHALHITKLDDKNEFAKLISFDVPWSKYYLVEFPKQGDKLDFKLKNKQYNSAVLHFEKDK
jgi:hypothetical protein